MLMQTLCRFAPRRHRVYRLISRLAPDRFEAYRIERGIIYLNLREPPSTVQVAMGTYELAKHAMIRRHIRPGMTFIDAGANMGDFTQQATRLVGSCGRVIAIEPAPENFSHLQRSIELNGYSHARVLPIAMSDQGGTASLQILSLSTAHMHPKRSFECSIRSPDSTRQLRERKSRGDTKKSRIQGEQILSSKDALFEAE